MRGGCKLCAWLSCTRKRCLLTMAGTFLLALHRSCQRSPTNRASLRLLFGARWMHTVCLRGQHYRACRSCLLTKAAFFFFALCWSRSDTSVNRASLRLSSSARRMHTVCLSCQHSQGLLADKGCRLPLCAEVLTDQSSKLAAALPCEADAHCLSVWPALAGAALPTKAAAFLFVPKS